MPTPRPVSKKLREILGSEAAETMVDWLDGLDERRDLLRHAIRADMAELRREIRADVAELRQNPLGRNRSPMIRSGDTARQNGRTVER